MYLDTILMVRIQTSQVMQIEKIMLSKNDKYENVSHFIRCAIIKLINEEKKKTYKKV